MKATCALLFIVFAASSLAAAPATPPLRGYGGIQFHSTVENHHEDSLKNDLRYVYRSKHKTVVDNFSHILGLKSVTGPDLHNWLVNRVRFVVGERFSLTSHLKIFRNYKYPNNSNLKADNSNSNIVTVMSNISTSYYQVGKAAKELYQLDLDGTKVFINSPRSGVIQVGEGLFHPKSLLNNDVDSAANSIQRINILFHEARHGDGNGKHTGFSHSICPRGHAYEGNYSCETVGNGPYSVGAYILKQFAANCTSCSGMDKAILDAYVGDSFSRIIVANKANDIIAFQNALKTYEGLLAGLQTKLGTAKTQTEKDKINKEIADAQKYIGYFKNEMEKAKKSLKMPPLLDSTPEGPVKDISLQESKNLMEKSLKGR